MPERIAIDNGPEFISKALDAWAYQNGVQLEFSRPGKPTDNAFAESFNGRFRDECLNQHWFASLEEVRQTVEAWRIDVQHGAPPSGAWAADAGGLGSGLGTGSEGSGLTFQVDQTGGQVRRHRANLSGGPNWGPDRLDRTLRITGPQTGANHRASPECTRKSPSHHMMGYLKVPLETLVNDPE